MDEVREKVLTIVSEHLGVDKSKIEDKSAFTDDLGADSLDQVELVMALEDEFKIEIPDDAAEKIQRVSDAINFIREKVNS
ncbi:MAG: acyl carrier protein [Sphingobacteriia bacterium]|nr:acyl carrier protein [Sphingobacteriia bacterium]